jgi:Peptidase S46
LSSARLNDGGSGSFVSPNGLLLTNHHVARGQLQKDSTPEHNYVRDGFYARTPEEEMKSPDLEVDVLISTEDVTARVQNAIAQAKTSEEQFAARRKVVADIERESTQKTGLRSDVTTLYQGAEYWLYRYKKYTDVRLVFAPEEQAAYFGGDYDNFTYPRFCLDMAFFRVYENGKPLSTPNYLKWNPQGATEGELVFTSGNPGSTSRLDTLAELDAQRNSILPNILNVLKDRIAVLEAFSKTSTAHSEEAGTDIFDESNSVKAIEGELDGLQNPRVMETKQKQEDQFRNAVKNNPALEAKYGNAWTDLAEAERKEVSRIKERFYHSMDSHLAGIAQTIVDYVAEIKKPDGQRLPGYHDAQLASLRFNLFSPAPIHPDLEIARITGALELDKKEVGPDDPFLKIVLDGKSPEETAAALVHGTKLADPAFRKQLIDGGQAAVDQSTDPMIVLARKLDPMRREFIKWTEDNVTSVEERGGEELGRARFAVYGKNEYPEATFTLRLSYGQVKGYPFNGTLAPPKTTFYGLYDRAASFNNQPPFNLTPRFTDARPNLRLATPFNFVTTNDIVGGNSGSPVINGNGELVGLIFDGNIESLVGDFVYNIENNRSVAVHTAGMTEALRKVYNVEPILKELGVE